MKSWKDRDFWVIIKPDGNFDHHWSGSEMSIFPYRNAAINSVTSVFDNWKAHYKRGYRVKKMRLKE